MKNEATYKIWGILTTAHYKYLNVFLVFFFGDCLAQAEELGLIPVFPLSIDKLNKPLWFMQLLHLIYCLVR